MLFATPSKFRRNPPFPQLPPFPDLPQCFATCHPSSTAEATAKRCGDPRKPTWERRPIPLDTHILGTHQRNHFPEALFFPTRGSSSTNACWGRGGPGEGVLHVLNKVDNHAKLKTSLCASWSKTEKRVTKQVMHLLNYRHHHHHHPNHRSSPLPTSDHQTEVARSSPLSPPPQPRFILLINRFFEKQKRYSLPPPFHPSFATYSSHQKKPNTRPLRLSEGEKKTPRGIKIPTTDSPTFCSEKPLL